MFLLLEVLELLERIYKIYFKNFKIKRLVIFQEMNGNKMSLRIFILKKIFKYQVFSWRYKRLSKTTKSNG